ncbi:hypothetical protein GH5_06331 [Leishmania sp. Ghana 2012 LV757]|uniref:hypothetical protein n=1 Tax=Leishmania sp. Ghana 2012 LV757 TaxID=2803181 RepID=UPI001B4674FA|nr:hypothetical protein GH5_06331 [Leishmania sp. Ghana 2012 LV757]
MKMSTIPQYIGCFTLLYADPEVKEQHQYLQPLYGLTADDDPPPPQQHQREWSQDGSASASSNSSSLISQEDAQGSIAGSQGTASLGEPTSQRHKYPRATSGVLPRPANSVGTKDDDKEEQPVAAAAAPARPPRKINHVGLSLYPDLSTGIVGPQPVFGGAAISAATAPTAPTSSSSPAAAAVGTVQPYLFASNGAPMLSSVVDADALTQLQDARRPYPAPQPRSGHVLLPCPTRGSLILFGGLGDVPFNDVWEYDVRTGRWAELPCAPATEDDDEQEAVQQQKQRRPHAQRSGSWDLDEGTATSVSTSSRSSEDEDDDDYVSDDDGEGTRAAARRRRRKWQRRNMPPPAYGQAASLYQDVSGNTCMAILGGISVGDICCSGFFSLNLNRLKWRRVATTIPFFDMWGATAQTLYAPRRCSVPHPAVAHEECGGGKKSGIHVDAEEQVVVLFGGMTEEGEVVRPVTHLFHFDHRLTAAEVEANPEIYLKSIEYEKTEHRRVMRHVLAERDMAGDHATGDNRQSPSIEARCSHWREEHADTLVRWRRRALKKMVGKYWAEHLPAPEDLHGRRRSTSAAYKRHFMYIFGGRDDFYFYNDLWCLNLITRTWVQVREGVPPHWLRGFLAEPYNPMYGILISDRVAQLRQETILKTEAKLLHNSTNGTVNPMFRIRDVHHALFASSVNSSARARTGACMVADVQRDCLYVYGGFSYTGQQHLTFFDLHAFHIGENVWRRVCVCRERPWEAVIDAAADAVSIVHPAEEGRSYARHASPSSKAGAGGQASGSGASSLPPTLVGYATRYLQGGSSTTVSAGSTFLSASLAPPLAPRGSRASRMSSTPSAPGLYSNCFHLPVFVPEARTMAAMAEDPLHPGARFFLHGGRCGEEACGDFFELRTRVGRTVDMEYIKFHRAAREEDAAGSFSRRSSAGLNTSVPPSASFSNPTAASMVVPSLVAADAASTQASGLSVADAALLQWNSRRQLQRQLIAAAVEAQEGFEDMPAAHYSSINDTVLLPRRTLRAAATRWIRDGLAAVDPKSLMFVELRNGHALVNLRTHIHYRSRLSLLGGDSGEGSGAAESCERGSTVRRPTTGASHSLFTANRASRARTDTVASIGDSISASSALATPMQLESMDGHLKRSARSLELLLYDVLLSKPTSGNGSAACHHRTCSSTHMPGNELMTSPCTHGVTTAAPPEARGMLPSHPANAVGGSPGMSPGDGTLPSVAPQIQVVSRAPHSTPRAPQALSTTLSGNNGRTAQEQLSAYFPSEGSNPSVIAVHGARVSSPTLASRSSSFCGGGGSGGGAGGSVCGSVSGGAPPANNEYAYHVLLRSLFYREPFSKANYSTDKRR